MADRTHLRVELAVDIAIPTARASRLQVLAVERASRATGQLALPSGFLRPGEDLPYAAKRELFEGTSLDAADLYLEQLAAYGAPTATRVAGSSAWRTSRSRRTRRPRPPARTRATRCGQPVDEVRGTLAFDHDHAVERARTRLERHHAGSRVLRAHVHDGRSAGGA